MIKPELMEGSTDDHESLRAASFSCYIDTSKHLPTKPPLIYSSFSKDSKDSLTNLRVDSFSYLSTSAEKFDPTPYTYPLQLKADKYFSVKLDHQMGMIKRDEGPVCTARPGPNPGPRTPSLCSKAGSWNSQTGLLQKNGSHTKQKRAIWRRIFSGFGCKEPCFNIKGVCTSYYGSKPTRTASERIDDSTVKKVQEEEKTDHVANTEEPRTSIEVFGSKTAVKGDVAKNMERKLSILTWDAIPKAQNRSTSTVGNGTVCDDMVSEASSDLFEIENISASIHTSICTSPAVSHYAASEASVQWSVVTGSAADNSASHCNGVRVTAGDVVMSKTNGNASKGSCKRRNGGLLGCKSLKAVDVAGNLSQANQKH